MKTILPCLSESLLLAVSWLWEWWLLCTNPEHGAFGQKWEEWVIPLGVGQPFRRISTGQRDGQRGTVWNSTKADAQSCIWGGTAPGSSRGWGCPAGEQLCRAGPVCWSLPTGPILAFHPFHPFTCSPYAVGPDLMRVMAFSTYHAAGSMCLSLEEWNNQ